MRFIKRKGSIGLVCLATVFTALILLTGKSSLLCQTSVAMNQKDKDVDKLDLETCYYNNSEDSIDGIYRLGDGNLGLSQTYKNYLFFVAPGKQSTIYKCIDKYTGEVKDLCPISGCDHSEDSKCPYMTITNLIPDNSIKNGGLYVSRDVIFEKSNRVYCEIGQITSDGRIIHLYGGDATLEDGIDYARNYIIDTFAQDNKLYFKERIEYYSKNKIVRTENYNRVFDIASKTLVYSELDDNSEGRLIGVVFDKLLFQDTKNRCYYIKDFNHLNRYDLCSYANQTSITFDNNTGELFVFYTKTCEENTIACVDVYRHGFEKENLMLPSESIVSIVITSGYIYYERTPETSDFESLNNQGHIDNKTISSKIYRFSRDKSFNKREMPVEEEVFNGYGGIFNYGYNVCGDNIYIKIKYIVSDGSDVWWRVTGDIARWNIVNKTIKWFSIAE